MVSLAYLWLRDQSELLQEMVDCGMDARIVKVCAMGLVPSMLGLSISALQPKFLQLRDKFGFNVCGEGGEYESAVFDCPLFKCKLQLVASKTIDLGNEYSPVSYLALESIELI